MFRLLTYCLCVSILFVTGCKEDVKKIDWSVNLDNENKGPYGSSIAYDGLKYYFPGAKVQALSQGFRYSSIDEEMKYGSEGRSLLILTGLRLSISDDELNQLLGFAAAGNEVVLFSAFIDSKLQDTLGCSREWPPVNNNSEEAPLNKYNTGEENKNCLTIGPDTTFRYGYNGRTIHGWLEMTDTSLNAIVDTTQQTIEELLKEATDELTDSVSEESDDLASLTDTVAAPEYNEYEDEEYAANEYAETEEDIISDTPEVLGYVNDKPDILRYAIGEGHITIHAAPLVMSNYFLLQDRNSEYMSRLWSTLPGDIGHVYWNSYFKHRAEHSDLGILWRHPATRWALWLSIITLILYVLLELKRRQQPIPIVAPLTNTSVSFVETVGRLYYNKGNHRNLAEKMTQHFLEHVRTHYYLNTNALNDTFIQSLANKSGLPIEVASNIVEMIHEIRLGTTPIDEPYLYHLNNTIQRFYKNHK